MLLFWMAALAFVSNSLYLGLLYAIQEFGEPINFPVRFSRIQGTSQKFLYLQDFHTTTWGDAIGIPLMLVAFIWLSANVFVWWSYLLIAFTSALVAILFARSNLVAQHKPDIGFPATGKISRTGAVHLPYLGFNVTANLVALFFLAIGFLPTEIMLMWISGLAVYGLSFVFDIKTGNFDPINKV